MQPLIQQVFTVRIKGKGEAEFHLQDSDTSKEVALMVEGFVQGTPPYKTCWISGGNEYEVCTPAHMGQAAHDERVKELQEIYPYEGDCPDD